MFIEADTFYQPIRKSTKYTPHQLNLIEAHNVDAIMHVTYMVKRPLEFLIFK